jgi:hypothetical protein
VHLGRLAHYLECWVSIRSMNPAGTRIV